MSVNVLFSFCPDQGYEVDSKKLVDHQNLLKLALPSSINTCPLGHVLSLIIIETGGWRCNGCTMQKTDEDVWRCDHDKSWARGGSCDYDICTSCLPAIEREIAINMCFKGHDLSLVQRKHMLTKEEKGWTCNGCRITKTEQDASITKTEQDYDVWRCIYDKRTTPGTCDYNICKTCRPVIQEASLVELAGSFNNWSRVPMEKSSGAWTISLKLAPGEHQYKFIVDNDWKHDSGKQTTNDNMGGKNNVIVVEKKQEKKKLTQEIQTTKNNSKMAEKKSKQVPDEEENRKEEASLGDFIGAMGSLMTAFAPKEDAEKLQEQVDQMAGLLSSFTIPPDCTSKDVSPKKPPAKEGKVQVPGYIKVSSNGGAATAQSDLMGIYKLQDEYRNNFPVWKKKGEDQYLFVAGDKKWNIGSDPDTTRAWIINVKNNPTPVSPLTLTAGWWYDDEDDDDDEWKTDNTIRVEAFTVQVPEYIKVSSNGGAEYIKVGSNGGAATGIYKLQDEYRNSFPVWKKQGEDQYLFVASDKYWSIGSDLDRNIAWIYNDKNNPTPVSPLTLTDGWWYVDEDDDDEWKTDNTIRVEAFTGNQVTDLFFKKVPFDSEGRIATVAEVGANQEKVARLLDEWTIAFLDGGKIVGRGYGEKIQEGNFEEECGEKIIVVSEDFSSDGKENRKEEGNYVTLPDGSQVHYITLPDGSQEEGNYVTLPDGSLYSIK